MTSTLKLIVSVINEKKPVWIQTSVNAAKIVKAQKDKRLKIAINNSDIVNIDGFSVVIALRCLGYQIPERIPGIDLFQELLKIAAENDFKVYFLGARKKVLEDMIKVIRIKYKDLKISGYRNGYFDKDEEIEIINKINRSGTDILFLGISSPKKEIFLETNRDNLKVKFCMGVGGSFDVIAGKVNRAPGWMQNWGLEWFYRLLQEPGRLWKRYLVTNTIFIILALKETIKHYVKKLR